MIFPRNFFQKQLLRKFLFKRIFLPLIFISVFIYGAAYFLKNPFRNYDRLTMRQLIEDSIYQQTSQSCNQPNLPIYSPEMMKFVRDVPPIKCNNVETNWVSCANFECRILDKIIMQKGKIGCSFTDILRTGDSTWEYGGTTYSDSVYKMEKSDVVEVKCTGQGKSASGNSWKGVLTSVRFDEKVFDRTGWEFAPEDGVNVNVLIFAIDSISRNTMIRKLPKTYKYLTEKLKAFILEGYNIIGDGTPQALTPMLTGSTELELPETRKRVKNADYVDVYPFIWKEFEKFGYTTAYLEEGAEIGTYTYRLRGFKEQPTDHYMRTYYLSAAQFHRRSKKYCAGSVPKHKVMLDFVIDFFNVYKDRPKFMFAFQADLSHDNYNLVGGADDSYVDFLDSLHTSGALNNTILISMADHGNRFAEIRNTLQGKLEERLPFYSFSFPSWFPDKHKEMYANFLGNLKTLVTPFDIHATLLNILHKNPKTESQLPGRSLSLFSPIPKNRSCVEAYIEPHWCACLNWEKVNLTDPITKTIAEKFVGKLNDLLQLSAPGACEMLTMSKVFWINKLTPNKNLIQFKQAKDNDGFVPDLSGATSVSSVLYQIKLQTTPGNGIFEATLSHLLAEDNITVKEEDISRINMYGNQPHCIATTFPNLRKFCYCKKQL